MNLKKYLKERVLMKTQTRKNLKFQDYMDIS